MENIRKWIEKMDYEYECLLDLLDEFESNPLISNKRKVKEQMAKFNYAKNILSQKVNDYWCKYQKKFDN